MSTYGQLITDAVRELARLEYSDAALEARELLGKALGMDCRSSEFEQKLWEETEDSAEQVFFTLVQRRLKNEPLQYILGEWDFYGMTLAVGPGVLIPRQDTELLVDIARKLRGKAEQTELIDLCAGSGCIGFAIEKQLRNVSATLVENYTDPMSYMLKNKLELGSRASLVKGDVLDESLPPQLPQADLIVCNPPYLTPRDMDELQPEVRAEPVEALYGGEFAPWLNGFSWEVMKQEAAADPGKFHLETYGAGMAEKPVLLVDGGRDYDLPEEENAGALCERIEAQGKGKLVYLSVDTDHAMNTLRPEIKQLLIDFFGSL